MIWMVCKISGNLNLDRGIIRERGDGPLGREYIGRGLCGIKLHLYRFTKRKWLWSYLWCWWWLWSLNTPPYHPAPIPMPTKNKKRYTCLLNNRTDGVADSRPSVQMVRMHQRSLFRSDQIKFVWSVSTTSGSKMSNVAKTKVFQLSACHDIFGDCNMKYFGWKTDFLGNGKYLWNAVWDF